MPELPDLEVIREFLEGHIVGETIVAAQVVRPTVLRTLVQADFAAYLAERKISGVRRVGKFLLLDFTPPCHLIINPMLAGRLHYVSPETRRPKRTYVILQLRKGRELRYVDERSMGKVYLTEDESAVPGFAKLGPDALDPALTLEVFQQRLEKYRGEIKGILRRQEFIAGIGNAYADEILWQAGVSPFRKRPQLADEQVMRIYEAMHQVFGEAIATLRQRVGEDIHIEIRDFLKVHRRGETPCPRCGARISEIAARRRITSFCRTCQPGGLVPGLGRL